MAARRLLRALPLAIVWLLALWPFGLYAVQTSDPELAVAIVHGTKHGLWTFVWWFGGITIAACVLFPPALAGLRLALHRTWRGLSMDQRPLQKALAELRHFETASRHLDVGRLARQRGRDELAALHLARAVDLDSGIPSAWHQLGLVHFAHGRWADAERAFARAEELDAGHAFGDAALHRGRCLFELGDAQALAVLQAHQQRHGGGARSHLWLADALQQSGDAAGAHAALREAAAPPRQRLTPEDNWFRALARVRLWGRRRPA